VSRNATITAMAAMLVCVAPVAAAAERPAPTIDLSQASVGRPPVDFEFARTGEGDLGRWMVVTDPTAVTGFAIEHVSTDQHEDRYPLAIYQPLSVENLAISVRFKIISGTMLSAGLALCVRSPDSYYAVSASALEQRVDLLLVSNGKAELIDAASDVSIRKDRWHVLKATLNDDHFVVALDGRALFTTYDRGRMKDGRIGLWTREDNVTRFDQIEIRPLPNTPWQ